jgi:hypothetical protein
VKLELPYDGSRTVETALEPRILRGVLPRQLFSAFQFYVRQLKRSDALSWEEWGHRYIRHSDPLAGLVHERLAPFMSNVFGRKVKPSYAFLACYGEGARLPAHRDRAQCRYTADLCIAHEGPAWPLLVEGRPYVLGPNEALAYYGCEQTHYRDVKPPETLTHLVLFHFVDAGFTGRLD